MQSSRASPGRIAPEVEADRGSVAIGSRFGEQSLSNRHLVKKGTLPRAWGAIHPLFGRSHFCDKGHTNVLERVQAYGLL